MEPTLRGSPWRVGGLGVQAAGVLGQSGGWCDAGSAPGLLRARPHTPLFRSQITACLSFLFQDLPSIPQTCQAWLIASLGWRRQCWGGSACSPGSWEGTQTLP